MDNQTYKQNTSDTHEIFNKHHIENAETETEMR